MIVSRMTSKGQTTLPIELRKALGLSAGDRVGYVRQPDGSFSIKKLEASFSDLRGIVKLHEPLSDADILNAVDQARSGIGSLDDRS